MSKIFDTKKSGPADVLKKETEKEKNKDKKEKDKEKDAKLDNKGLRRERNSNGDVKLNLIKDEIVKVFDWKKNIVVLLIAICLTIASLSGAYWGISWWGAQEQEKQVEEVVDTKKIIELNQEITIAQERVREIEDFERRMQKTHDMISSHIYWSNFFDFLQRNTLAEVHYSGFSGGVDGNYSLTASANDYSVIDAQIKRFLDHDYVVRASVEGASLQSTEDGGEVSFTLNLVLDPGIFTK